MEGILTKAEREELFEKIKAKMTRKDVTLEFGTVSADAIFRNATIDQAIKRLEKVRNEVSISHTVPADQIRTSVEAWQRIKLYVKRPETDAEFLVRVKREANQKINSINNDHRKKILQEAKQKEKDKKELARIMANLGPEIYEVFEQIKKEV